MQQKMFTHTASFHVKRRWYIPTTSTKNDKKSATTNNPHKLTDTAADNARTHNGHWTQHTHAYFMLDTTAILTINNQADIKHAIRNSVVCTKDGAFI